MLTGHSCKDPHIAQKGVCQGVPAVLSCGRRASRRERGLGVGLRSCAALGWDGFQGAFWRSPQLRCTDLSGCGFVF